MGKIEWTDRTWNPVIGCSPVSAGCANCWAARIAGRHLSPIHEGLTGVFGVWNGKVKFLPGRLEEPLRWRKPGRVAVALMGDLFHPSVPFEFIDKVFSTMVLSPQQTFQVLTKRPHRVLEWQAHYGTYTGLPVKNIWIGVSVEDQKTADERIPALLSVDAAVRFVSCEPLLGAVDLHNITTHWGESWDALEREHDDSIPGPGERLDWVIVGGESGHGARPCRVEWVQSLVQQCRTAAVPCFVKQLGASPVWTDNRLLLHAHGKCNDPKEWPEELRVREFPRGHC